MRKPAAPKIAERDVLKSIQDYAATVLKITLHRRNTGMTIARYGGKTRAIRYGKPGQADLYGIKGPEGVAIECEVKARGNRPTEEQEAWLASCANLGAIAIWVDSVERFEELMLFQYAMRDWPWPRWNSRPPKRPEG